MERGILIILLAMISLGWAQAPEESEQPAPYPQEEFECGPPGPPPDGDFEYGHQGPPPRGEMDRPVGFDRRNSRMSHRGDRRGDFKDRRGPGGSFGPKGPHGEAPEFPPPGMLLDERFSKMLDLATIPEDQIGKGVKKWKKKKNVPEMMQKRIMGRAKKLRDELRTKALDEAKKLELTLDKDKENEFIRAYWEKRIEVEKALKEEFESRKKALEEAGLKELKTQFTSKE